MRSKLSPAPKIVAAIFGALLLAFSSAHAANVDPRTYSALNWRLVGPFRGGWASAITGVPDQPDVFYFGAAGGGIWRTDDAGRTWKSLFDKVAAIGAIAVAPSNPNMIYAGTGQAEPRYDTESGSGVYKSTDGGRTWQDLGLERTRNIGRIWVSPVNPDVVVVAAIGNFFGPGNDRGIYRSTDGGQSWSHVLAPGGFTGAVDIASDPAHPGTLFGSTWEARQWPWTSYFTEIGGLGSALYRSDDEGAHWHKLSGAGWPSGPLGRLSVTATRKDGKLRLYAVADSRAHGGLWRSDDAGAHWHQVNSSKSFTSFYANRITVDPRDPDVVYLVGRALQRCDRGGEHCMFLRGDPTGNDYHQIWINPKHPDHMASASDQGAAISVNGSASWSDWYNQPTGQFYHLATDNRFPYWIYSGQQDGGTVGIASRSDFGAPNLRDWHPVGGDERDYEIPDPVDPNIVYGSGLGGHVSRFDSRTGTSADISSWSEQNYGVRQISVLHHFYWLTPLALSRVGPPALYLGGEVLFQSLDRGNHWTVISPDLTGKTADAQQCDIDVTIENAMACGYGAIASIQTSSTSPDEIWVGTDTGLLQITRDSGAHWQKLLLPGIKAWSAITSIDLSVLDPGTAYVAVDPHRLDDFTPYIFRTHDGGRTWQAITAGLPVGQTVSVVRADPVRRGLLYAGTEGGVFVSFDDGNNWQRLQQNLPTAWVRDLTIHGDDLVAATQGRAIWILGDLSLLRQLTPATKMQSAQLFTPAPTVRVRFDNNRDTPFAPETPVGENPPVGAVIDYWIGAQPARPVVLKIRDSSGAIIRRFSSDDKPAPSLPADHDFPDGWVKPQPILSAAPGGHRWIWNLRKPRPLAVQYNWSTGVVWGRDTPLVPEGQLVQPGRYTIALIVDGHEQDAALDVLPDPRQTGADYAAVDAFSNALAASMEKSWRGAAEMDAVRKQIASRLQKIADPQIRALTTALAAKLEPSPIPNSGFAGENTVLASIETAVEAADSAPTSVMRQTLAREVKVIDADWDEWQHLRATQLAELNRHLTTAGLAPISIPQESDLRFSSAESGVDLP